MSETTEYDDLAALLAKRERIRPNRLSYALLAGLVLVVGFIAGAAAAKQVGLSSTARTQVASGLTPGASGSAVGSGSTSTGSTASADQAISGTVTLVDGAKVYVTDAAGAVFTVTVPADAAVVAAQPIALVDLVAGMAVEVRGQAGSNGSVTATSVTTTTAAQDTTTVKGAGQ